MHRTTVLVFAWMAAVFATGLVSAQEPQPERRTPRVQLPKTLKRIAPDARVNLPRGDGTERIPADPKPKTSDRIREFTKARTKTALAGTAATLADLGAIGPFDYSASGSYLVAAVRDGAGMALWDTVNRKRLRRLENSDRQYSLVAISDEARWIAGVRHDDSEQIDLWRADNGRHVRVIRVAPGPKSKLEFTTGDELRVVAANGDGFVFSIPSGVAVGGFSSRQGGSAMPKRSFRFESPKEAIPAAPSTSRAAPPSLPPIAVDQEPPSLGQPLPPGAGAREPRIPASPPPQMARPRAISREPRVEPPPPTTIDIPEEMPDESVFEPASPAPDEPSLAAPDEPAATAPFEPSVGAARELTHEAAGVGTAAPSAEPPAATAPGGSAPGAMPFHFEMSEESPAETGPPAMEPRAAPAEETKHFHFEVGEERPTEAEPPPAAASQPPADAPRPTSVDIHFATNRNRLAPKDREWAVYFVGFFASLPAFVIYGIVILALLILPWFGKRSWGAAAALIGVVLLCAMGLVEAYVRSQLRDEMTGEFYGCRPTDLSYGICEISVPPPTNRRPGELSRPVSVWIFETPENPEKHFMLRRVEEHKDKDAFYRSLAAQMQKSDTSAALLFIHGYNVSFEDAIFRTAQLAVDLKFPGAPIAFCWPSYADPVKYPFDEQQAEVSIPALREVLDDLAARSGAKRVHIIAHSMGNRVLAGALRSMDPAAQARNKAVFRELVLAAPDIDTRVFQSQVLPHIVRNTQHCTLYASSRDRALLMSRCFHNYQRLGETQPELLIANDLDTIDASLVDTSLLGHSYIGDVQSIVSDLHDLVVGGKRPTERSGLEVFERNALKYWSIKPQLESAADPSLRR